MRTTLFFACTLAGAFSSGCLDADPYPFPDASEDAAAEASDDVSSDVDLHGACLECFRAPADPGPGCLDSYDACHADAKCRSTLECSLPLGCFARPTQPDVITCGTPCAQDAGILSAGDPSVLLIFGLITCALNTCKEPCGGTP